MKILRERDNSWDMSLRMRHEMNPWYKLRKGQNGYECKYGEFSGMVRGKWEIGQYAFEVRSEVICSLVLLTQSILK